MFTDGNALAYLALVLWPGVVVVMFRTLSLERALIWSILGGYMVLPQVSAINLPGIPSLDKVTIPNLTAFAACVAIWGRMPSLMPVSWVGRALMVAFLISPSFTVLTNLNPIQFGLDDLGGLRIIDFEGIAEDGLPGLPGLRMYDSLSVLAGQVLLMLPFFLAREVLRTEAAIRELMVALLIGGAAYALPMLFEVRFSPQLHTIIYGFFQHDFIQAIRAGGYRPFMFMPHGLWVAFFAFMVLMSAAALWRAERRPLWGWAMSMGVMLVVICKSMGVIVFALVFVPLALMLRPRAHLAVAVLLSAVVLTYPALRGLGAIPTDDLVARVAEIAPDRAQSLEYRFNNENRVLAHSESRPWLGWGGWGRFFPHDPETGSTSVVVDGLWIIMIGNFGWLGFAALFGLLALPLWSLWWQARNAATPPPATVTILALVLAVNMVDLLPNATLVPLTWLIAGALLGHAESLARDTARLRSQRLAALHSSVALGRVTPPADGQTPRRRTVL
jgi:hypothetical protein